MLKKQASPHLLCNFARKKLQDIRHHEIEQSNFKKLSKKKSQVDLLFLKAHGSAVCLVQADESDIANIIRLERRTGLNLFVNVVIIVLEEL